MLLDVAMFADRCGPGVSSEMIRHRIRTGKLQAVQLGGIGKYLIDDSQIPGGTVQQPQHERRAERMARGKRAEAALATV